MSTHRSMSATLQNNYTWVVRRQIMCKCASRVINQGFVCKAADSEVESRLLCLSILPFSQRSCQFSSTQPGRSIEYLVKLLLTDLPDMIEHSGWDKLSGMVLWVMEAHKHSPGQGAVSSQSVDNTEKRCENPNQWSGSCRSSYTIGLQSTTVE